MRGGRQVPRLSRLMHSLAILLQSTLHWVSPHGRVALEVLAACGGVTGAAHAFAARVGLRSRHQLARLLMRDGLPAFETLAAWVRLLTWVEAWERAGTSLHRWADRAGTEPAVYYRAVKRLTGKPWSAVRGRGMLRLLRELRDRCPPSPSPAAISRTSGVRTAQR